MQRLYPQSHLGTIRTWPICSSGNPRYQIVHRAGRCISGIDCASQKWTYNWPKSGRLSLTSLGGGWNRGILISKCSTHLTISTKRVLPFERDLLDEVVG